MQAYFKGYVAWRSAFAMLMEHEQPIELPCHARESLVGNYRTHEENQSKNETQLRYRGTQRTPFNLE